MRDGMNQHVYNASLERQYLRQKQRRQQQYDRLYFRCADVCATVTTARSRGNSLEDSNHHHHHHHYYYRRCQCLRSRRMRWILCGWIVGIGMVWSTRNRRRSWIPSDAATTATTTSLRPPPVPRTTNTQTRNHPAYHSLERVASQSVRSLTEPSFAPVAAASVGQPTPRTERPARPVAGTVTPATHHHHHHQKLQSTDSDHKPSDGALPVWLAAYVDFHRRSVGTTVSARGKVSHHLVASRQPVANATTTTTTATTPPTADTYLLYTCHPGACGGLGDRIFGALQVVFLAVATHRLVLIDPVVLPLLTPSAKTNLTSSSATWRLLPSHETRLVAMDDRAGLTDPTSPVYVLSHPETLPSHTNVSLHTNLFAGPALWDSPSWQSYLASMEDPDTSSWTPAQALRQAFFAVWDWDPSVPDRATRLAPSVPYVAVHVRTGRSDETHRTHTPDNNKTLPLFVTCARTVQRAVRHRRSCGDHPRTTTLRDDDSSWPIYVASDDGAVKQSMLEQSLVQGSDWTVHTHLELEGAHVDQHRTRETTGVHKDKNDHDEQQPPQPPDIVLDAFAELLVLQRATCRVLSHSKFSEVAAVLADPPCAVYFDDCGPAAVQLAVDAAVPEKECGGIP